MSRLTKGSEKYGGNITKGMKIYNKLFDIENLEEELGIDLITLFKALKNGIYTKEYGHLFVEHFVLNCKNQLHCRPIAKEVTYALKDYGKTWWLKEENKND